MNHEEIKNRLLEQAKEMGLSKADAKVLSTDPFFVGSPRDYEDAEWAARLWDTMMAQRRKPIHLRGFHYWVQSRHEVKPNGELYAQKDAHKDWQWLLHAAQMARYLGIGNWDRLIDLKHPDPEDYATYYVGSGLNRDGQVDVQELLDSQIQNLVDSLLSDVMGDAPQYDTGGYQVYHLEVWCLSPDTKVWMNPKPVPISEVQVGDRVMTHRGVYKEVVTRFERPYDGDILTISLNGYPDAVKVTPNHLVLGKHRESVISCDGSKHKRAGLVTKPNWIPSQNLKVGDFVAFPIPYMSTRRKSIRLDYGKRFGRADGSGAQAARIPNTVDITPDFLEFLGWAVAEGDFSHGLKLTLNRYKESDVAVILKDVGERIFGLPFHIRQYGGTVTVTCDSVKLGHWFRSNFGGDSEGRSHTGSRNKRIPKWLMQLLPELQKHFLDGLFAGDGSKYDHWDTLTTSSDTLAYQVWLLLLRQGLLPSMSKIWSKKSETWHYRIRTSDDAVFRYGWISGTSKSAYGKRYAYLRVKGISSEPYTGKVYNIEVADDNSYVASMAVHNCEKNSMGFVLGPACRKYDAVYQPLIGQASVEKTEMAARRAIRAAEAGKKVRIFYIADWDRYGWSMVSAVARKIEYATFGQGLDIKVNRLALNDDQIDRFNLPKAPKLGEAVVELDALEAIHPGELGKLAEEALSPYYDADKPKEVKKENRRIRDAVQALLEERLRQPLTEALAGIDIAGIAGDVDMTTAIDVGFEIPEPGHEVDENGTPWVFDSRRSYWQQWAEYKRYKEEREEEVA